MSGGLRILLVVFSLLTLLYMIRKIRNCKLQIQYAIFWVAFALLLLFMSLFPGVVTFLTGLLGVQSAVNFVYLCIIFILMLKIFMMTIELSQLENKIQELTQKISIEFASDKNEKKKTHEESKKDVM